MHGHAGGGNGYRGWKRLVVEFLKGDSRPSTASTRLMGRVKNAAGSCERARWTAATVRAAQPAELAYPPLGRGDEPEPGRAGAAHEAPPERGRRLRRRCIARGRGTARRSGSARWSPGPTPWPSTPSRRPSWGSTRCRSATSLRPGRRAGRRRPRRDHDRRRPDRPGPSPVRAALEPRGPAPLAPAARSNTAAEPLPLLGGPHREQLRPRRWPGDDRSESPPRGRDRCRDQRTHNCARQPCPVLA